jgi:predicted transcriptional regulator
MRFMWASSFSLRLRRRTVVLLTGRADGHNLAHTFAKSVNHAPRGPDCLPGGGWMGSRLIKAEPSAARRAATPAALHKRNSAAKIDKYTCRRAAFGLFGLLLIRFAERSTRVNEPLNTPSLAEMTAEIVSAYVSHNAVSTSEISSLIGLVGGRLATLGTEQAEAAVATKPEPAVPVRRSVGKDQITCLMCGKKQKLLKRHLATAHDLTPDQYRELFALKSDYPMVAPSYAASRSELALRIGLGRPKKKTRAPKRTAGARAAK